jgi:hypothetical protein
MRLENVIIHDNTLFVIMGGPVKTIIGKEHVSLYCFMRVCLLTDLLADSLADLLTDMWTGI